MSNGTEYYIAPRVPGVRPADDPDYDGITFVYCFTTIQSQWVVPPPLNNVTVVVQNSQGFVPGMSIAVEGAGYYQVVSSEALDRMTIQNLGYPTNAPPGTGMNWAGITTTSLPGPMGPSGETGMQGDQGDPGPPLNAKGYVNDAANLPMSGNTPGDMYQSLADGHAYSWNGVQWVDLGPFQGPVGPIGPIGETGPQGQSFRWMGDWVSSTAYQAYDVVNGGGTSYVALSASTGIDPTTDGGVHWAVMAEEGAVGPIGPVGPAGPQGAHGVGLNMKGTVPTASALPPTGNQPNDTYTALDTGHGWTWTGTAWIDIGPIQGPVGPAGPIGPAGSTGSAGPPGSAATVNAGTTTTLNPGQPATVTNVGSTSAAIFNFGVPQGNVGATGINSCTPTTAGFVVPPVGQTTTVTVVDASWVVVGEMIYIDQAGGGAGQAGALQVTSKAGNTLTLLNPQGPAVQSIPLANASQSGLLTQLSGNTTDFVDGTNHFQNLATAVQPTIYGIRTCSWNSIGNPNFEINQRSPQTWVTGGGWTQDRWQCALTGALTAQCVGANNNGSGYYDSVNGPYIPGTSYLISHAFYRISTTIQKASLAAADACVIFQTVEGVNLRQLVGGSHSVAVMVRSSVAPLTFGISLRNIASGGTKKSLLNTVTISTANTWQILTLPNLATWASDGTWLLGPGTYGYEILICPAGGAGHTNQAPANGTWQTGDFWVAQGNGNLFAGPSGTTFDIAFVQHEPNASFTGFIDKGWQQNFLECLRYYEKSVSLNSVPSFSGNTYQPWLGLGGNNIIRPAFLYQAEKAKVPSVIVYWGGVANQVYQEGPVQATIPVGTITSTTKRIQNCTASANYAGTGTAYGLMEYSADTAW